MSNQHGNTTIMSDHSQPSTAPRSDSLRTHALGYAKRGIHVFPLGAGAKTPITAHGFEDATIDQDQINTWWRNTPDANIGIACGASGWAVIDFDTAKEEYGEESEEIRLTLEREYPTLTTRTRSGGYHYIYSQPETPTVRNSEKKIAPAVDTRGEGGYIVAPPSVVEGRYYSWHSRDAIAPFPSALLPKLFRPSTNGNGNGNHTAALNGNGHHGPEPWHKIEAAVMALSHRRSVDHADWLAVGMAIHSEDSGGAGYSLWDRFSQRCSEKYDAESNARRWKSFEAGGGKTIASVYEMASQDDSEWRTRWWRAQYKPASVQYQPVEKQPEEPPELAEHMNTPNPTTWFVGEPPAVDEAQVTIDEPPVEQLPGNPFATWQFKSIAVYAATPPPEVVWIIDGLLPANSVSVWHGLPGSLKTQLLLDMAGCVATGDDWLPRRQGAEEGYTFKTTKTKVLWANFDMAEPDMHARAAALYRTRPHTCDGDLQVVSLPNPWLDLSKAIATQSLAELIAAQGFGLVFIDNLSNAKGKAVMVDETIGDLMMNLRRLSAAANCSVCLVHHETKNGAGKTAQERMFGGVQLAGAVELGMSIQREQGSDRVTLQASKQRNHLTTTSFAAEHTYQQMPNGQLDSFRFFSSSFQSPIKQEEKSPLQSAVLRVLMVAPLRPITVADVAIKLGGEYKENSVRNALTKLVDAGVVRRQTEGNTSFYSLVQADQPRQGGISEQ